MAEIALGILGPAIDLVKRVGPPIKCQLNYLCCFTSNIKGLEDEAKNLDAAKEGLQRRVDRANDNAQDILPEVRKWLDDYDSIKAEMARITDDVPRVKTGCSKLPARYGLSRRATKETARMKELREEQGKFSNVALPGQPPAREELPTRTAYDHFESRKDIEDGIVTALKDKDLNMIGICGMGGAGKTTMAVEIMNKLREDKVFDEIVEVVITQQFDKLETQNEIAGSLGLKFEEGEVQRSRVQKLRARLAHPRRVLVLLDDVWEKLELEELGISCKNGRPGCKVLVTSRDTNVLARMEIRTVFKLVQLSEEESWILFRGKAGACVDGAELKPIAKEVMRQCDGLPVALAAVGEALKDENEVSTWEDALKQLKSAGIPDMIEKVYKPLKLSYDRLDNYPDAKPLFLLCCLFPEDYNIPLDNLTYFAMGLHLFKDIHELKDVRNRTRASVKKLRNRCLLLDGSDEDHVRMHDVVRDVSTYIASKVEKRVKCHSNCTTCTGTCTCPCTCTWISCYVDGGARHVPREESCFPKLKLLWMNNIAKDEDEMDNLIRGSTELNVLFIMWSSMKELPVHTTQSLKISLTTLVLHHCSSLESIAVVGQLESLEILICRSCRSIKELPEQANGLKRLKLLEISSCSKLKRIAAGVISSLVALEELKIVDSFSDWKGWEIDEERNDVASLREIESLKKLRCLNIDVSDIALAAQPLRLSFDKLVQFTVQFGELTYYTKFNQQSYQRRMSLRSRDKSDIIDLSANIFLTRTECLSARAENNQDFNLNLATVQNLRWLNLECFTNKKNITSAATAAASFPLLEYLCLDSLEKLEEIWDDAPIPSNSFNNLKELSLFGLHGLKRMGKCVLSTANDFFLQLEIIAIRACPEMEHLLVLVPNEEEQEKEDDITFSKLKRHELHKVPKLRSSISSRGIESIQFPLLAEMKIGGCMKLKCLVASGDDDHCQDDDDDDSLHLFCNPKVSFGNLKKLELESNVECKNVWCDKVPIGFFRGLVELHISNYGKIRRLFSSSSKIPQNLVNLQKLDISDCKEMVKVIEDDEDVSSSSSSCDHPTNPTTTSLFPSLQKIELCRLPKLESFCEWRCAGLELPSLKELKIGGCFEMKSFNAAAGSLIITPALQTVTINLQDLKLKSFCEWTSCADLLLPSLEKLEIFDCVEMKSFNAGAGPLIITPALQTVKLDWRDLECVDDLNAALLQHFEILKMMTEALLQPPLLQEALSEASASSSPSSVASRRTRKA